MAAMEAGSFSRLTDQSPVEMPSGVTGHDVPEHSLGAAVALTERVEDVEIVSSLRSTVDERLKRQSPQQVVLSQHPFAVDHSHVEELQRLERLSITLRHVDDTNLAGPVIHIPEQLAMNPLQLRKRALGLRKASMQLDGTRRSQIVLDGGQFHGTRRTGQIPQHIGAGNQRGIMRGAEVRHAASRP